MDAVLSESKCILELTYLLGYIGCLKTYLTQNL